MAENGRVNGHRPRGLPHLLSPVLRKASAPKPEDLPFDLDEALKAVVGLTAEIPDDAFTAPFLGTEREGNGVVIDDNGLVLTIGYLITEAMEVTLSLADGGKLSAEPVGYDYDSGFGLVRAVAPIDVTPLPLGESAKLKEGEPVIVAGYGGREQAVGGKVLSLREFAGYWEYMLDTAVFTTPPHPNWGGTAVIGHDGTLCAIGSLYVEEAAVGKAQTPGNMSVPIDLLKPIFSDLITFGRGRAAPRPWLGLFTAEAMGHLFVAGVAPTGPADFSGLQSGDVIVSLNGMNIENMADLYRKLWAIGPAGVTVHITVLRGGDAIDMPIRTANRYDFLKSPTEH